MARGAIAIFAITAFISSTTTSAQQGAPQTQPQAQAQAQAQAKAQAEAQARAQQAQIDIVAKRLCKAEPVVGTRLAVGRQRCKTPAELAEYQRQAREMIENFRRRPCATGVTSGDSVVAMSC